MLSNRRWPRRPWMGCRAWKELQDEPRPKRARLRSAAQPTEQGGSPSTEDHCPTQEANTPLKRLSDVEGPRPVKTAKVEKVANSQERTTSAETSM
eukprot:2629616-Pyramimonas_sp.AAC.1